MELNKQKESLGKHTEAQKKYEKMQERMGKANEMAKKGKNYQQILQMFYPGTTIE